MGNGVKKLCHWGEKSDFFEILVLSQSAAADKKSKVKNGTFILTFDFLIFNSLTSH
jgi:hypothetical protein